MTTAVVFPFDLFGSAGTGAGAQLLGDALREILDDNAAETTPTRADVYRDKVRIREAAFETPKQIADWRKRGRSLARQAVADGDFLLWLSGNHLGVLPMLEELGGDTLVIQFDAHFDLHAGWHDTTRELSHGNFLSHLDGPKPRIIHVGNRDLFLKPATTSKAFESVHAAAELAVNPEAAIKSLKAKAAAAKRIWIDLDCDVFDPRVLSGRAIADAIWAHAHVVPEAVGSGVVRESLRAVGVRIRSGPRCAGHEFEPARLVDGVRAVETIWRLKQTVGRLGTSKRKQPRVAATRSLRSGAWWRCGALRSEDSASRLRN